MLSASRRVSEVFLVVCGAQGQGVLSDKLRSFSMQDLTMINAEDELGLHSTDGRMRRDPMEDMSSGSTTLPRTRTPSTRQSEHAMHARHAHARPATIEYFHHQTFKFLKHPAANVWYTFLINDLNDYLIRKI